MDEIPVIDISGVLAGDDTALAACAKELRHAYEDVGFWFLKGHPIPQAMVDEVFAEVARFHALPLEEKLALRINEHNIGYLPMKVAVTQGAGTASRPNLNEAYFIKRDLPPDHPDVRANKRFRGPNQWPATLPGFRETIVAYCDSMEQLALSVLPIYAVALDLPPDYFASAFREPQYNLRMSHYPNAPASSGDEEFGIAPHTDTAFMTLLAQNKVPGLSLRTVSGRWIDAPAIDGSFLVNSGMLLNRWSNGRFRATPHRVINRSGGERYAIPFFFDPTIDHEMVCLPSCTDEAHPPRFEPTSYGKYMAWYHSQPQGYEQTRGLDGVGLQEP